MSVIEHEPWIGDEYLTGIEDQKVAVIGFSHHVNETDHPRVTADMMSVIAGEGPDPGGWRKIAFFVQVRNAFGFSNHRDFWKRVMFFNFIPNSVGRDDARYAPGSATQLQHAEQRVLQLFEAYAPNKAFLFSTKAWNNFPKTRERQAGDDPKMGERFDDFRMGHYDFPQSTTTVLRLRHPQGARRALLADAVRYGFDLPN